MPRERNARGQFKETVTVEDILSLFEEVNGPVITSRDIADQYDCTTEAARQKLRRAYDQGHVDRRKIAGTTIYWAINDEVIHRERQQ